MNRCRMPRHARVRVLGRQKTCGNEQELNRDHRQPTTHVHVRGILADSGRSGNVAYGSGRSIRNVNVHPACPERRIRSRCWQNRPHRSQVSVHVRTPRPRATATDQLEACSANHPFHCRRRMNERTERIPTKASCRVLQADPGANVPGVSWIRQREATFRVSHGCIQQPLVVSIATDHPVHRNDVGGRDLTRKVYKITVDESDRRCSAPTRRLSGCRREIGRRQVDTDRFRHSELQQLERQHADAGSDVEQPSERLPSLRNARQQESRRNPSALRTVVCEIVSWLVSR